MRWSSRSKILTASNQPMPVPALRHQVWRQGMYAGIVEGCVQGWPWSLLRACGGSSYFEGPCRSLPLHMRPTPNHAPPVRLVTARMCRRFVLLPRRPCSRWRWACQFVFRTLRVESFGETWTDSWPGGCERRQTGGGALALAHGVVHVRGSGPRRCLEVRVLGFVGLR